MATLAPIVAGPAHPAVSIVAPVFRNAETLDLLARRVAAALDAHGQAYRLVLVVDASPDASWEVVQRLGAEDPRIAGLLMARNVGQHDAVLAGLASARSALNVVMDADLQDPPEVIPDLLRRAGDTGRTVFARRQGRYERWDRLVTSRLFKTALRGLTGVPRDVGTFFVVDAAVAASMIQRAGRSPHVVVLAHQCSAACETVDFDRPRRPGAGSSYSTWARVRAAARAVRCAVECRRASAARDEQYTAGMAPVAARVNL